METSFKTTCARLVRVLFWGAFAAAAVGCATETKQLRTPRYTLSHPDFWQVKAVGEQAGAPTILGIGQYGDAHIDDGSGALDKKEANYDTNLAEVEARIYTWPAPAAIANPSEEIAVRLADDEALKLRRHTLVGDRPPECNMYPKKYKILGAPQTPLDLLSRPGWRTIVIGAQGSGQLVGVVARVEYQQDPGRYCRDLNNLQVQLQNVLDGLVLVPTPPGAPAAAAPTTPAPATSPAAPAEGTAPPAKVEAPAGGAPAAAPQ
jgi:hypothetical protein